MEKDIVRTVRVDVTSAVAMLEALEERLDKISEKMKDTGIRLAFIENFSDDLSEELTEPPTKEELLEDFSTEELVRELEKRGAANIHRTDDKNLFVFTGNFYTD